MHGMVPRVHRIRSISPPVSLYRHRDASRSLEDPVSLGSQTGRYSLGGCAIRDLYCHFPRMETRAQIFGNYVSADQNSRGSTRKIPNKPNVYRDRNRRYETTAVVLTIYEEADFITFVLQGKFKSCRCQTNIIGSGDTLKNKIRYGSPLMPRNFAVNF